MKSPDFTLDEVNCGTYEHTKLCRSTLPLDPELPELDRFPAIFTYTGAPLFPRLPEITHEMVISATNKILFKLLLGGIILNAVKPMDIGYGAIYKTGYFRAFGGASGHYYTKLFNLQSKELRGAQLLNLLDPIVYKKSQIYKALSIGNKITKKLPQFNSDIFLNGISFFKKKQLSPALVFLWASFEGLINQLWEEIGMLHTKWKFYSV